MTAVAATPSCPLCGAPLLEIRGKAVCSRCGRICEGCCEGAPEAQVLERVEDVHGAGPSSLPVMMQPHARRPAGPP